MRILFLISTLKEENLKSKIKICTVHFKKQTTRTIRHSTETHTSIVKFAKQFFPFISDYFYINTSSSLQCEGEETTLLSPLSL